MVQQMLGLTTVIFGAAIIIIAVCRRIGVPPVIGFILTGLAVGPHATGFIRDPAEAEALGELGIVFLLFMVGMDFTPNRLSRMARTTIIGGSIQMLLTFLVAGVAVVTHAIALNTAILGAFVLLQSSTAIALKVYHERGEINTPHAETSLGISLFQDLSAIALLVAIPFLGVAGMHGTGFDSLFSMGRNLILFFAGVVTAFFILPFVLKLVIDTGIRELIVLLALVLCFGFARFSQLMGFSLALGAFICGVMLSRSSYQPQITAEAAPFRDVFLSLFFISIGMELNWSFALHHLGAIASLTAGVMVAKSAILFCSARALRFTFRTSLLTGVGLSNIGEFGFVIMIAGAHYNLFTNDQYQIMGGTAIFSMLLTPLLIAVVGKLTVWKNKNSLSLTSSKDSGAEKEGVSTVRVVIAGFGLAGKHLARVLKSSSVNYGIVECNGRIVQYARAAGEPILFGDIVRREILERIGITRAQVMVFLISDPAVLSIAIPMARLMNPGLFIICRTRRMSEIEYLLKAGANEVVSEEFETSIELFTQVLTHLHVPRNIIRAQTRLLREDGYEMLRVPAPIAGISDKLAQVLALGTTDIFQVMEGEFTDGKSLQELELRRRTGVTVIAVVREERHITNPPPDLVIQRGDALVLVGSHAQLDAAFGFLEGNGGNI